MAAANPNPARITAPLWRLWTDVQPHLPGVRLGGIYADKSGYHNTRAANQAKWPGNYSIRTQWDLRGPADKAAALDLTLSDAEMRKRTGLLRAAALHPQDNRLDGVREFYGTLDSKTVFGLIRDSPTGPWRPADADISHTWHIHMGFFRELVDIWSRLEPVASTLTAESWEQWQARKFPPVVPATPAPVKEAPVTTRTDRYIEAWAGGTNVTTAGERFHPVTWRTRDEAYQARVELALAGMAATLSQIAGTDPVDEQAIIDGVLAGLGGQSIPVAADALATAFGHRTGELAAALQARVTPES